MVLIGDEGGGFDGLGDGDRVSAAALWLSGGMGGLAKIRPLIEGGVIKVNK